VQAWSWSLRVLVALWAVALSGCAIQLVAEYDKASEEKLIATYERVNRMYDSLAEAAPADRTYAKFSKAWADIATDLRVLALRQKARVSNKESQQIVDKLVENWEQARARHKQRSAEPASRADAYRDSLIALDRAQFEAQFAAAVAAEVFKK
jgi:type VI protein secretion system component VasF